MSAGLQPDETEPAEWVVNAPLRPGLPALRIGQVWQQRELILFFAQRDVKVRYKQAFLGAAWAALNPFIGALAFTILFDRLAKIDVGETPYFAFALAGFITWNYFSTTLSNGTGSLLANGDLLTKVALPRIVPPTATLLPGLVDLAVGIAITIVVSIVSGAGIDPVAFVVFLPLGLLLLLLAVAGPVLLFSATIVRYRDVGIVVGFGLQLVLFLSPVAYPSSLVPEAWRVLYYANPLAGALGLLRAALLDTTAPPIGSLALSFAVAIVGLVLGLTHFRRHERSMADII
ncbi:MAG: ABC transporter permease [Ilumatobacteraceae bacterium]